VFFFVAGLVVERGVAHHGPRDYVRGRVLRLGLPWAVSALLVWPASVWLAYTAAGRNVSFGWVLSHRDPLLDSGSLWFALVLLVYSVAFAVWHGRTGAPAEPGGRPLSGLGLAVAVVVITVATFTVRLWIPARSGQIADLHLWQWPQCLGMFVLGVAAARHGWQHHVPDRVRRACAAATVGTLVALPTLALASGVRDVARDAVPYLGGWHWAALGTAATEGVLVVAGSVWLVGLAEPHGAGHRARRWSRAAFPAFVVQGPVLLALASAARPLDAPAEIKGPLVGALAIWACFGIGRLVGPRGGRRTRAGQVPGG
jgi:hypothetical protein